MTTLYKLTNQTMTDRNGYHWVLGEKRTASGVGPLYSNGWLLVYNHATLAILMNPIHEAIPRPRLFHAEGVVGADDRGLKMGCKELTLMKEVPLPPVTLNQHIKFGILCARAVFHEPTWTTWSDDWLSGDDRSARAARMAKYAASVEWAEYGACAPDAAEWAADAAMAADAVWMTEGMTWEDEARTKTAKVSEAAATAAAMAAMAAAADPINFIKLAEQAMIV
jgi:hypothetical protein